MENTLENLSELEKYFISKIELKSAVTLSELMEHFGVEKSASDLTQTLKDLIVY